jgi:hypothetical protein
MGKRKDMTSSEDEIRAARLSKMPGVSMAEACERTGTKPAAVTRALRRLGLNAVPTRHDLLMACLTAGGKLSEGFVPDLNALATYLKTHSHDETTAAQIQVLLDDLVARGVIAIAGGRFRLVAKWPASA